MRRFINLAILTTLLFGFVNTAWAADKDESIYVVQERAYSKRGKFEITPIFMAKTNTKYTGFVGGSLSLAYHIRENFALELAGGYAYDFYSTLVEEVYRFESQTPEMINLKQMKWFTTFGFQWSPFYGKLRLVPGHLGDFDFYIGTGLGIAETVEPCLGDVLHDAECHVVDSKSPTRYGFGHHEPSAMVTADRFKLAGNFSIGLRIFFKDWLGVRIEMRDIIYADKLDLNGNTTSNVTNNLAVFLGLSFLLGK